MNIPSYLYTNIVGFFVDIGSLVNYNEVFKKKQGVFVFAPAQQALPTKMC